MTEEEVRELFEDLERPITGVKTYWDKRTNNVVVKAYFANGLPEVIGRFNPAKYQVWDSEIIGKSKIEAIFYLEHKKAFY